MLDISIPGIPDDDEERQRFHRWTAGLLLRAVTAIADAHEIPPDAFFQHMVEMVTDAVAARERALEDIVAKLDRMRRERLLPENARLKHISRYEAQHHRQFYNAVHELEAAQSRRRGEFAPLARVQVHGLPGA